MRDVTGKVGLDLTKKVKDGFIEMGDGELTKRTEGV